MSHISQRLLCKECNIWVGGQAQMLQHVLTPKHQSKILQNTHKEKSQHNGIYVQGFLPETDEKELKAIFSKYGTIKKGFFGKNKSFYIAEFDSNDAVEKALAESVVINNRKIHVDRRIFKTGSPGDIKKNKKQSKEMVQVEVTPEGTWEEQSYRLARILGLPKHDRVEPFMHHRLTSVCASVREVLWPSFPNCCPYVFGSSLSGLAGPDSDVDIYVNLGVDHNSIMTPEKIFYMCRNLIFRSRHIFKDIVAVAKARVPVIKAIHVETGVQCDLNFKNSLSVYNTELMHYYLNLHPQAKHLVIVLKHWMKSTGLDLCLTSYAMGMMAVFFMVQLQPPLLPSVQELQANCKNNFYVVGWPCTFERLNFKTKNKDSLRALLIGFFTLMKNFDFGMDVMCVQSGKAVPKWRFLKEDTVPADQNLLKECMKEGGGDLAVWKAMCVQDPIELNHNIVRGMGKKSLSDFRGLCEAAATYCRGTEPGISGLFKVKIPVPIWNAGSPNEIFLDVGDYVPSMESIQAGLSVNQIWYNRVVSTVRDIMTQALLLNEMTYSNKCSSSPPKKIQKVGESEELVFQYTTKFCLWISRKTYAKKLNDGEAAQSKAAAKDNEKVLEKPGSSTETVFDKSKNINLPDEIPIKVEKVKNPDKIAKTQEEKHEKSRVAQKNVAINLATTSVAEKKSCDLGATLAREKAISEFMLKNLYPVVPESYLLDIVCTYKLLSSPTRVLIDISDLSSSKLTIKPFVEYLKCHLQTLVDKCMEEKKEPPPNSISVPQPPVKVENDTIAEPPTAASPSSALKVETMVIEGPSNDTNTDEVIIVQQSSEDGGVGVIRTVPKDTITLKPEESSASSSSSTSDKGKKFLHDDKMYTDLIQDSFYDPITSGQRSFQDPVILPSTPAQLEAHRSQSAQLLRGHQNHLINQSFDAYNVFPRRSQAHDGDTRSQPRPTFHQQPQRHGSVDRAGYQHGPIYRTFVEHQRRPNQQSSSTSSLNFSIREMPPFANHRGVNRRY